MSQIKNSPSKSNSEETSVQIAEVPNAYGYTVSSAGEFFKTKIDGSGKLLPIRLKSQKRCEVALIQLGLTGTFIAKTIVAEAFVDNPKNYKHILCVNLDDADISAGNLRWVATLDETTTDSRIRSQIKKVSEIKKSITKYKTDSRTISDRNRLDTEAFNRKMDILNEELEAARDKFRSEDSKTRRNSRKRERLLKEKKLEVKKGLKTAEEDMQELRKEFTTKINPEAVATSDFSSPSRNSNIKGLNCTLSNVKKKIVQRLNKGESYGDRLLVNPSDYSFYLGSLTPTQLKELETEGEDLIQNLKVIKSPDIEKRMWEII